jgi:hypothetical protein
LFSPLPDNLPLSGYQTPLFQQYVKSGPVIVAFYKLTSQKRSKKVPKYWKPLTGSILGRRAPHVML